MSVWLKCPAREFIWSFTRQRMPRCLDIWTAFEWSVNFFKHLIKKHKADCISNCVVWNILLRHTYFTFFPVLISTFTFILTCKWPMKWFCNSKDIWWHCFLWSPRFVLIMNDLLMCSNVLINRLQHWALHLNECDVCNHSNRCFPQVQHISGTCPVNTN